MLNTTQKAGILRRTGVDVPSRPSAFEGTDPAEADTARSPALVEWAAAVDRLFVSYGAARAAKGLRDAEEAQQLDRLRRMAATPVGRRRAAWAT